jgi:hypothetical protein
MSEPTKDKSNSSRPWIIALALVAIGTVSNLAAHVGVFDAKSNVASVLLPLADLVSLGGLIWIVFLFQRATYPPKK